MEKEKQYGNKSKLKTLWLFVVIILVSSLLASLLSHNFGKVDIKTVRFDGSRGAIIDATLYTPFGMSPDAQLPAIVITHGAGVAKGIMAGIAEELARRGFVVLNVSGYGAGASENPASTGEDKSNGIYDSVEYLRTLRYVDPTRIGITGHSAGGTNVSNAAIVDGNYYTLNDMMINVLYDTFGQKFAQDEINLDADTLAGERLSVDQYAWYSELKKDAQDYLSHRINAVLILGRADAKFFGPKLVTVGGYEVTRTPVANGGYLNGIYNEGSAKTAAMMMNKEEYMAIFQTDKIVPDIWYLPQPYTNTDSPTSTQIGNVWETSITSSKELAKAIEDRRVMVFFTPSDHHSQNFISAETTTDIIKFFEQTLSYNNGELLDASTTPIDAERTFFLYREALNGVAMISMFLALIALATILLDTTFFKVCKFEVGEPQNEKRDWVHWVITAIVSVVSAWAVYAVGKKGPGLGTQNKFFSQSGTIWQSLYFLVYVAIGIVIVLTIYLLYRKFYLKKDLGFMRNFNVIMKFSAFAKTFLLAFLIFLAGYISMAILQYVFHQDYRFWMAVFTDMNPQNFLLMMRYGLIIFLPLLVYGIYINFGRYKGMADGPNTALNVILASAPLWILFVILYVPFYLDVSKLPTSPMISTWPLFLLVPAIAYISMKLYKYSGSVWLGALVNTFLITWMLCSSAASSVYVNGSLLTKWFGF